MLSYWTPEGDLTQIRDILVGFAGYLPESLRGSAEAILNDPLGYEGEITFAVLYRSPVALYIIEKSKKSAEIHGVAHPELPGVLVHEVGKRCLEDVFFKYGKRKAVAKVPADAKGAVGFLWKWGFRPVRVEGRKQTDGGDFVYTLPREKFLKRYVRFGQKEGEKG